MTQDRPDRLDRIEAALESLQQRLDSQVEVNASLRTSVETLRTSVTDLRVSAEALLETTQIHQQNFEIWTQEIRSLRSDVSQVQQFERTTSITLDRMGAILELLVNQQSNGSNEQ